MDNVIDATDRWSRRQEGHKRLSLLEQVRQTTRLKRDDAILIGRRLGEIAEHLSPERPLEIARRWFDDLWNGERWQKRKRYILLNGEHAPATILSNGSDWAALIEHAASRCFPDMRHTAEKERDRAYREILRGTSFLPALNVAPLRAETAQTLLCNLVKRVCETIDQRTELESLWAAIQEIPFEIHSFDFERPVYEDDDPIDPLSAKLRSTDRFAGDAYSLGPLGDVSLKAGDVSASRYRQDRNGSYRFEPTVRSTGATDTTWQYPMIRLGLLGYRHEGRIFVIPHDFFDDLPAGREQYEDGEKGDDELLSDWLAMKGIMKDEPFAKLPEIAYSAAKGFGWKSFVFNEPRNVWLEVRPRPDSSVGLWLDSSGDDCMHCYPVLANLDALAVEGSNPARSLSFLPQPLRHSNYEYLRWPDYSPEFMVGQDLPHGAASGLLELPYEERPDIAGWVDDLHNAELQEFLFRLAPSARFYASIEVDDNIPPPCRPGTVAAAIFSNAGCQHEDRLAVHLLKQAGVIAENGLAFYEAILAANREQIEMMLEE